MTMFDYINRNGNGDIVIIGDIRFGAIKQHDLDLSRDMILNSEMLNREKYL